MNTLKSRMPPEESQAVLRALVAKTAVLIGVLGVIFYVLLTTPVDPVIALSLVDTVPSDPASPAPQLSDAAARTLAAAQPDRGKGSDGSVRQAQSDSGNVMTYEHD